MSAQAPGRAASSPRRAHLRSSLLPSSPTYSHSASSCRATEAHRLGELRWSRRLGLRTPVSLVLHVATSAAISVVNPRSISARLRKDQPPGRPISRLAGGRYNQWGDEVYGSNPLKRHSHVPPNVPHVSGGVRPLSSALLRFRPLPVFGPCGPELDYGSRGLGGSSSCENPLQQSCRFTASPSLAAGAIRAIGRMAAPTTALPS
jgi:hypothetical protein